jgi:hypothetical protein
MTFALPSWPLSVIICADSHPVVPARPGRRRRLRGRGCRPRGKHSSTTEFAGQTADAAQPCTSARGGWRRPRQARARGSRARPAAGPMAGTGGLDGGRPEVGRHPHTDQVVRYETVQQAAQHDLVIEKRHAFEAVQRVHRDGIRRHDGGDERQPVGGRRDVAIREPVARMASRRARPGRWPRLDPELPERTVNGSMCFAETDVPIPSRNVPGRRSDSARVRTARPIPARLPAQATWQRAARQAEARGAP